MYIQSTNVFLCCTFFQGALSTEKIKFFASSSRCRLPGRCLVLPFRCCRIGGGGSLPRVVAVCAVWPKRDWFVAGAAVSVWWIRFAFLPVSSFFGLLFVCLLLFVLFVWAIFFFRAAGGWFCVQVRFCFG
jgi:hypothetical protein